ncbi:hypothetical protein G8O24_39640 [Bradyrhizobium sp. INPA01-394B]|jgi:hypothetical protein|nr:MULTISPECIES: hypothetical protein [Nitrobacteraceae]MBC9883405.1 hypothetical protein [Bradyrhizobium campsiandrae]MBC9984693.1 hypothetical protein [Bradyrhizobium campsiandrae]MBQ8105607.1 hypothetical protein [Afipia sp.]
MDEGKAAGSRFSRRLIGKIDELGGELPMLKLALALAFCLAAADAQGRASGAAQGGWSKLSAAQMHRLPGVVRLALHQVQAGCGADAIRVKNGFATYLPISDGRQVITIHFEHVECGNGQLCAPEGCLHRVLFSGADGKIQREIWRGKVREIDTAFFAGSLLVEIDCSQGDSICKRQLKWNGKSLQISTSSGAIRAR